MRIQTPICAVLAVALLALPVQAGHCTQADILAPTAFQLLLGQRKAGFLTSLAADDGDALTVCHFFLPNVPTPFIRLRLTFGPTHKNPSELKLIVKGRAVEAGVYDIELQQRDWVSTGWVTTLPRTRFGTQYAVYTGEATGDLSRFVNQDTGETQVEVRIWRAGPFAVLWPCMDFEYTWQSVAE